MPVRRLPQPSILTGFARFLRSPAAYRAGLVVLLAIWGAPPRAEDLRAVLENLSTRHGFKVEGLRHLSGEVAEYHPADEVHTQIRDLLRDYNHLVVEGADHHIHRLIIVGTKRMGPRPARDVGVTMTRDGHHHRVDAVLVGPNGRAVLTSLIIDTGASNLVLPESMIDSLGFRPEELRDTASRTASGTVPVKTAVLESVEVGSHAATGVGVMFAPDRQLGDLRLLGMSFLGRFRVTIDDAGNQLILSTR